MGIALDTSGNVALVGEGGFGFGTGLGGQAGLRIGVNDANHVEDLRGVALTASAGGGLLGGLTGDISIGNPQAAFGDPSDAVLSGGASIGPAAGLAAFSGSTLTGVIPLFNVSDAAGC